MLYVPNIPVLIVQPFSVLKPIIYYFKYIGILIKNSDYIYPILLPLNHKPFVILHLCSLWSLNNYSLFNK